MSGIEAMTPDRSCRAQLDTCTVNGNSLARAGVSSRRGKDAATMATSKRYGPDCDIVNQFELCEPDV